MTSPYDRLECYEYLLEMIYTRENFAPGSAGKWIHRESTVLVAAEEGKDPEIGITLKIRFF
jgi:hypothetical protein